MKMVLFHNTLGFDTQLQSVYLYQRKIPFWIYFYNFKRNVFQRIEDYNMKDALDEDLVLISLEDKGDFFRWAYGKMDKVPNTYFPKLNELRHDDDFIAFVERFCEELEDLMEVVEVPNGEKYRILEVMEGQKEVLELEKDAQWSTAE